MNRFGSKVLLFSGSMSFKSLLLVLVFWLALVAGCTTLRPDFETPLVSVTSFKPFLAQSLTPRFEIGMRVVNPNSFELNLRGISYKILLNDYDVLEGAANALPVVPAYGEAEFNVIATVSLIEGMRFMQDMLRNPNGRFEYRFQAKLDVGPLIPSVRIEKTGSYIY